MIDRRYRVSYVCPHRHDNYPGTGTIHSVVHDLATTQLKIMSVTFEYDSVWSIVIRPSNGDSWSMASDKTLAASVYSTYPWRIHVRGS